nr:EOG090X0ARF [Cyclestheria hislopi]
MKLEQQLVGSDDDSQLDSSSVISSASENRSVQDEGGEIDEDSQIKALEEKLKEVIDLTSQKSSHGRTTSFESLCKAFSTKYLPEFVTGRRMTLMDCIERGLKKGRGAEQEAAAKLAVLLCLQLGSVSESEMIYKEYKSTLLTVTSDHSMPLSVRAECATTVGLCSFLAGNDLLEVNEIMLAMEAIFSSAGFRSSEGGGVMSSEMAHLHSAALSSWTLLLTLLSPRQIYDLSQTHVRRLSELLDSTDVDVRIGAGEAIALIYEGARNFDEDFGFAVESGEEDNEARQSPTADVGDLCHKLRQLATDSHKYRAKKDRKQQRSSFRDILRAIEENEAPDIRVKFGKEILDIDSWARKRQYDTFCQVLGSGMNLHLTQNEMVREIFELGPALLFDETTNNNKTSKLERHHLNMAAFKARSVARAKNRDKRTAVF